MELKRIQQTSNSFTSILKGKESLCFRKMWWWNTSKLIIKNAENTTKNETRKSFRNFDKMKKVW